MNPIDTYYEGLNEPLQGYMLAIRRFILNLDEEIEETWKWSTPFFTYRKRMLCYLWRNKKTQESYLSIYGGEKLKHPDLVQMHKAKIKKLMLHINEDVPLDTIREILLAACELIQSKHEQAPDSKIKTSIFSSEN